MRQECLGTEGAERLLEQFGAQRDSTLDACASTIAEGKTLLDELKSANNAASDNSASSVQATLDRLSSQRDELGEYRGLAQYVEFKFR